MTRKLLLLTLSLVFVSLSAAQVVTSPAPPTPVAVQQFDANAVPPARFADPERKAKLAAAFPEIDRIFREWAQQQPVPGLAWGIVIDGELVHAGAVGLRNLETKAPMTVDSVSRIASMTKSFTAVAIMKLRDEGKLALDDPVAKYIPELAALRYPTKDSPLITIRHLLSHNEGFPEDNPWGDRQLAIPPAKMSTWMKAGIPFSTAPGTAYEYSNYGFAILGQVVARVSGMSYRDFVDKNILQPLGMTSTKWEAASAPDRVATGYKREGKDWIAEVPLPDGSFGAMGGLYSSVPDLARWVSFFLDAYPPRDDADTGPLRRSSRRLMQTLVTPQRAEAIRERVDGPLFLSSGGYAFGLGVDQDCRFGHIVSHGGGLPGFGSTMVWLPEYGVGIVAVGNRTYAGPGRAARKALEALARPGALKPRVPQPSQPLLDAQAAVNRLYENWSDDALKSIAADNLLLDRSLDLRRKDFADLHEKHGNCRPGQGSAMEAENALRGQWTLACDRGQLHIGITLAPTTKPSVQRLNATSIFPLGPKLAPLTAALASRIAAPGEPNVSDLLAPGVDAAPVAHAMAAAGAWGVCRVGEVQRGGGDSEAKVRFDCDHGPLDVSVALDAASGKLKQPTFAPAADETCVP